MPSALWQWPTYVYMDMAKPPLRYWKVSWVKLFLFIWFNTLAAVTGFGKLSDLGIHFWPKVFGSCPTAAFSLRRVVNIVKRLYYPPP